jgi:hypothetical protein
MYRIEKKPYGYKLTFSDFIKVDEMTKWVEDSKKELATAKGPFGIFVDMRELKTLTPESTKVMTEGQLLYKEKGLERSAVILENAIVTMQFKRIAKQSGIYAWERYINASAEKNCEKVGEDWITKAIDPDQL